MNSSPVAILVIAYRRSDLLATLLSTIPADRQVYIVIDGPKLPSHVPGVQATRLLAMEWSKNRSRVNLNIREQNLGGPIGIPAAIDWAFCHETKLCIFEEDCIPSPLVFDYIDGMATFLESDASIAGGTLNNFVAARLGQQFTSSFLSLFPHCWGWYTSKELWMCLRPDPSQFDSDLAQQMKTMYSILKTIFPSDRRARQYWMTIFAKLIQGEIYHWDYAFTYNLWSKSMKFIAPPVNLAANIGADQRALNCKNASPNQFLAVPMRFDENLSQCLYAPVCMSYNYELFDRINQGLVFTPKINAQMLSRKVFSLVSKVFPRPALTT